MKTFIDLNGKQVVLATSAFNKAQNIRAFLLSKYPNTAIMFRSDGIIEIEKELNPTELAALQAELEK